MTTTITDMITMDELFWRAVAGAAMLGAVAGPIGCFVLWRRMAYLGASIAEMALLGAALGLLLRIDPLWAVLATRGIRAQGIFLALVAGLIAFGLKVVGALFIVALIIIPPAAARPFARTPEAMAILAALIGAAAAPLGLFAAFTYDLPAGPAIVLAATAIFILSSTVSQLFQRRTA